MTIKEKILKIMSLALENEEVRKKRVALLIEQSPSLDHFDIRIYKSDFYQKGEARRSIVVWCGDSDAPEKLDEVIEMLKNQGGD